MGSATTNALTATRHALAGATGLQLSVAAELFEAARALSENSHLLSVLADSSGPSALRRKVVTDVFGSVLSASAVSLLSAIVDERWSSEAQFVDGIEELAVRVASEAAADSDVEAELFAVSRLVIANPELELALGSRTGDGAPKADLVRTLLQGRAGEATTLIVSALVRNSHGRRVRQVLRRAMTIVADQRGRTVATVTSAAPLSAAQADRLAAALTARYGTTVTLNTVVDPTIVGGVRVQVADDLIDASVASRIADLRQRLAG